MKIIKPSLQSLLGLFFSIFLFLSVSSLLTTSCASSGGSGGPVADSIVFTIKQGGHYCTPTLSQTHNGIKRMSYYIQFEENCKYKINNIDSNDINKGYGFGYGNYILAHQDNSTRLGWNWKLDTLMLYNYAYLSSQRMSKKIGNYARRSPIYIEQWYQGTDTIWVSAVQNGKGKAAFVTGKGVAMKPGYRLYPYFGGTSTAPNNMSVKVWGVRTWVN